MFFLYSMEFNMNSIRRMAVLLLIISALFLQGCGKGTIVQLADDSQATNQDTIDVVNGNNQFTLELYSELKDDPKNDSTSLRHVCSRR